MTTVIPFNLAHAQAGAKFQTRKGEPARLAGVVDRNGDDYPVHCIVGFPGREEMRNYTTSGYFCATDEDGNQCEHDHDLIMCCDHVEWYCNVYQRMDTGFVVASTVGNRVEMEAHKRVLRSDIYKFLQTILVAVTPKM